MIIIRDTELLKKELAKIRSQNFSTGFVPTMGALHAGHISLIENCNASCSYSICSIFVNPAQFNNKEDLQKYPRTLEQDINMLEEAGCDLLFLPEIKDIYPDNFQATTFNLGNLDNILEGKFRPGHFQGVCQVVSILISLIQPEKLFLGEKDYQQCLVISKLAELENWNTKIVIGPTLREPDGLAMSSRNLRIKREDRQSAAAIFNAMNCMKRELVTGKIAAAKIRCEKIIKEAGFEVEYFTLTDEQLNEVLDWDGCTTLRCLVAASIGGIRLIDNMKITT